MLVSKTLRDLIKLSPIPAYKLALRVAKCHPTTFSKLLNGAERVRKNDPRILAVGERLGLAAKDCFVDEIEPQEDRVATTAA